MKLKKNRKYGKGIMGLPEDEYYNEFSSTYLLKEHSKLMRKARSLHRKGERLDKKDLQKLYKNSETMQANIDDLKENNCNGNLEYRALKVAQMEALDYFNCFWCDKPGWFGGYDIKDEKNPNLDAVKDVK